MRLIGITVLFSVLFVAICYVAAETVTQKISRQIKLDVVSQLEKKSIYGIDADVDGRDVTLVGDTQMQQSIDEAINIASHRPGVRLVMNKINLQSLNSQGNDLKNTQDKISN